MKAGVGTILVTFEREIALIRQAASVREPELEAFPHEAWRLINGPADGAPAGFSADKYGDYLVVNARAEVPSDATEVWCDALWSVYAPRGLLLKTLGARSSESSSRLYRGSLPDGPVRIVEAGVTLLCNLDGDVPTGLYLDLHDVRRWFGQQTKDHEILNLFAYTCSFSVHAVAGGARRVTSVDVAKKALRRGRENMQANGFDADQHRWFADDVPTFLQRAVKRGELYDWIVLDPPAFGRAGKKRFELKSALPALLDATIRLLSPNGRLLLSVHTAGHHQDGLWAQIEASAARVGRSIQHFESFGLPVWDHPVTGPGEADRGDYLQVLVVGAKCA